jgi:hypothetical protein
MSNLQNINLLTEQNEDIFANRKDEALKERENEEFILHPGCNINENDDIDIQEATNSSEEKNNDQLELGLNENELQNYSNAIKNLNDNARLSIKRIIPVLHLFYPAGAIKIDKSVILAFSDAVKYLKIDQIKELLGVIIKYNDFNEGDDSYNEHDFAKVIYDSESFYWKIDYYDQQLTYHSENPADENKTIRVITIAYLHEY